MKKLLLFACLVVVMVVGGVCAGWAQDTPVEPPTPVEDVLQGTYGVVGVGFSGEAQKAVIGFGAYGIPIRDWIMSFTGFEIYGVTDDIAENNNFMGSQLAYTLRTGIAIRIKTFGADKRVSLWGLGDGGFKTNEVNLSGSFAGGGFVDVKIKDGWGIVAILQADKDAITGTKFAPKFGIRKAL